MNVCSVLINTLDYLNPPSELGPVTRTKGSERSKIKPSPQFTPKISLLIKLLSLPFLCICPPSISPPSNPSSSCVCCPFVSLSPCSSARLEREDGSISPLWLNGLGPLSITAALCSVKAAFQGTSAQMKLEQDGNYRLGFLKSMLLFFSRSIWRGMGCKGEEVHLWGGAEFAVLVIFNQTRSCWRYVVETVLEKLYLG